MIHALAALMLVAQTAPVAAESHRRVPDEARAATARGDHATAAALTAPALATCRQAEPQPAPCLDLMLAFAMSQTRAAQLEAAIVTGREALAIADRTLTPDDPRRARARVTLAQPVEFIGRRMEAEALLREALALAGAHLPAGHRELISIRYALGTNLYRQGRLEEAGVELRAAMTIVEGGAKLQADNLRALVDALALVLEEQRRFTEAEAMYRRSLALWEAALPPGSPRLAGRAIALGKMLSRQEKYTQAEAMFARALAIREAAPQSDPEAIGEAMSLVGRNLTIQRRLAEAELVLRQLVARYERTLPPGDSRLRVALNDLAGVVWVSERGEEAGALMVRSLDLCRRHCDPRGIALPGAMSNYAVFLMGQGKDREAEPVLAEAIALIEPRVRSPEDRADLAGDYANYGVLLARLNRPVEAEAALRKAVALGDAAYPRGDSDVVELRAELALFLHQQRSRAAERRTLFREAGRAALADLKGVELISEAGRDRVDAMRHLFSGQVAAAWDLAVRQ